MSIIVIISLLEHPQDMALPLAPNVLSGCPDRKKMVAVTHMQDYYHQHYSRIHCEMVHRNLQQLFLYTNVLASTKDFSLSVRAPITVLRPGPSSHCRLSFFPHASAKLRDAKHHREITVDYAAASQMRKEEKEDEEEEEEKVRARKGLRERRRKSKGELHRHAEAWLKFHRLRDVKCNCTMEMPREKEAGVAQ